MRILMIFSLLLILCSGLTAQQLKNINPDPKGDPWIVGGFRELTADEIDKIPELQLPEPDNRAVLPFKADNSNSPYFRGIILQSGGSCGQASGVAYVFTYEVNFLRGLNAKDSANQYPSHFTYNFLNKGNDNNGSNYTDGWNIIKENGCPNLAVYGGLYPMGDKGWMSGYEKYLSSMQNRVNSYSKISLNTPQGLNTLKRWLFDHGNGSAAGGLACFSAGIATAKYRYIPYGSYMERKRIVYAWSDPVDHAMTFIGYDDSIRFDFNMDKKYTNDIDINGDSVVDMRDWEIGALKMVNSWAESWMDSGFIYVPYRLLAMKVSEGGISGQRAYVVIPEKKVVQPDAVVKLKLAHEKREKITIKIGISEDINATSPEEEFSFTAFTQRGGPYPMQGNNNDPIELALDISPVFIQKEIEPVKLFLRIYEDDEDTTAKGTLFSWSFIDYRGGMKELISNDTNLELVNNGITTSSILLYRPESAPSRLSAGLQSAGVVLTWYKPENTSGLICYHIYRNGLDYANTTDTTFLDFFSPNGTVYKVKAEYLAGLSAPTNSVAIENDLHLPVAGSGSSLRFDGINDCVHCGSGINIANHDFTIEFWARRFPNTSNQFVIGAGKWNASEEGLHIGFRDNKLMCGFWGDDVHTDDAYMDSSWHHWAITYDTTTMKQTIWRDGVKAGERKATAHYRGVGKFYIGCMKGNTWYFEGEIDEVRVWDYVRNKAQLDSFRFFPLNGSEKGLLGYWRFDEFSGDTAIDLSMKGNTGTLKGFDFRAWKYSEAWMNRAVKSLDDTIVVFTGYSKYGHPVNSNYDVYPSHGKIYLDSAKGQVLYIPDELFSGKDSFAFFVYDDSLASMYKVFVSGLFPEAIKEVSPSSEITLLTNPVSGNARLYFPKMLSEAMVFFYDMQGKRVLSEKISNAAGIKEINSGFLRDGLYLIKILSPGSVSAIKMLKKED